MRLYHFTAKENLKAIQGEGLKPRLIPRDGFKPNIIPSGVVWFTRVLGPPSWWTIEPNKYWCCIEVVLPTSDSRLKSLERWYREENGWTDGRLALLDAEPTLEGWRDHMLYFGHVEPRRIKRIMELHVGEPV